MSIMMPAVASNADYWIVVMAVYRGAGGTVAAGGTLRQAMNLSNIRGAEIGFPAPLTHIHNVGTYPRWSL